MSLVGSLEDLGLADILQIVSLARKSGVLRLRCAHGEGRIVFRQGLVHAAAVKGESDGFESLLERRGVTRGAVQDGEAQSRLEAARRELVERAVVRMFDWRSGEFSFDVSDDFDPGDAGKHLSVGLSPQYLTMEATRLGDERRAERSAHEDPLVFSGEAEDAADARVVLIDAILRRAEREDVVPSGVEDDAGEPGSAGSGRAACAQAVVVDPDLAALEWLKATLADLFERIHIFQGAEGGIARIRQYLSRGELPAVLLSDRAPMDPLSGIDSPSELLRRLRVQAPRMPLLLLAEEGGPISRAARFVDGVLLRPATTSLLAPQGSARVASAARALRARLAPFAGKGGVAVDAAEALEPARPREAADDERGS